MNKFYTPYTDDQRVNVGRFLSRSMSEGPGWRAVVWVQGCAILCAGCCNPHLLPFIDNQWVSVDDLAERIIASPDIEGVSFLGGEPMAQARALARVAEKVRQAGLSVAVFSGYTYEELQTMPDAQALLAHTDLLFAGPFIQARYTESLPWVGSDNQTIHCLTPRYQQLQHQWNAQETNTIEIRISANELNINGFAYADVFQKIIRQLRLQSEQHQHASDTQGESQA